MRRVRKGTKANTKRDCAGRYARPASFFDISIAPNRRQWWPGSETIDLNPAGREQTKEFGPMLPVLPLLAEWLNNTINPGVRLVDNK